MASPRVAPATWLGRHLPSLLLAPLAAHSAAAVARTIEVQDMPYQLAGRLEGVYAQWGGRWMNGPVYRRTEASFQYNSGVPIFMGPFCGYVYGGLPSTWCIAQCEEEHMLSIPGLLLPCDLPPPDGTQCPPAAPAEVPEPPEDAAAAPPAEDSAARQLDEPPPAPSPPPPRPVHCALLGHARRWHEAGNEAGLVPPPPEYWRLNRGLSAADWVDARGAAMGTTFSFTPRATTVAPPGERLRLRKDKTLRPSARSELCLGAERGALAEGVRLIFWDCGHPPYRHERFEQVYDAALGGHMLRLVERPELCALLPSTEGVALVLGRCGATAGTLKPAVYAEVDDGTLRVGARQELCLGTGPDRPELGSELRASRCALPMPEPASPVPPAATAPAPAPAPQAQDTTVAVLQAVQAFQQSLEARLDARVQQLEREVAALRAERPLSQSHQVVAAASAGAGVGEEPAGSSSNTTACTARTYGGKPLSRLGEDSDPFASF